MTHRRGPDGRRVTTIVAVVAAVAVARVAMHAAGPVLVSTALVLDVVAGALVAFSATEIVRCAPDRRSRRAWVLLAASPLAWSLAPLLWLAGAPAVVADAGRAAAVALVGASWWCASRSGGTLSRLRLAVDGGIGAAAAVVVAWEGPLGLAWRSGTDAVDGAVAVALPVAMVGVTVMGAGITLTEMPRGRRARPTLFMLGTLLIAASDVAWAVGAPPAWAAGWMAYALTIRTQIGTTPRVARVPTRGRLVYLPYALVAPAAVVLAVQSRTSAPSTAQVAACGAIVALLLVRQHLTLLENDRLVLRLEKTERLLRHRATHDSLTGLVGRAELRERLSATAEEQEARPGHVALAFVDVDRFKDVNDRYGHASGDAVLVEVARRLTDALADLGGDALAARLGGDEFAVLLTGAAAREVGCLATRLTTAVNGPLALGADVLPLVVSVGVATVDRERFDPSALLHQADLAMYEVKRRRSAHAPS